VFHRLSEADIERIVDIQLEQLAARLTARGLQLELTAAARQSIAKTGYDPDFGARPLKRVIQREVADPIALELLKGEYQSGDSILVDARPDGGLTHLFPEPASIASLDQSRLAMPAARKRALAEMCDAIATGKLTIDPGVDRLELEAQLVSLPGIGPWTAGYIAMRALGDPDAFLPTDLGIRHALERLGAPGDPKSAASHAEAWRPWRSYALAHLWASLDQRSQA